MAATPVVKTSGQQLMQWGEKHGNFFLGTVVALAGGFGVVFGVSTYAANVSNEHEMRQAELKKERELWEAELKKERELRQADLQKERELRQADLQKERELRQVDLQKAAVELQKERELRKAATAKESELRQELNKRVQLLVNSQLFQLQTHADYGEAKLVRRPHQHEQQDDQQQGQQMQR